MFTGVPAPGGGEKIERKVPLGTVTECKLCLVARSLKTEGNHALDEEGTVSAVSSELRVLHGEAPLLWNKAAFRREKAPLLMEVLVFSPHLLLPLTRCEYPADNYPHVAEGC